jgi:hypothetical protein
MDWTLGVFLLGLPLMLIAITYKEPEAYEAFVKPGLLWCMGACSVGSLAALAGEQYLFHTLTPFFDPGMKDKARTAYDTISIFTVFVGTGSVFLLLINVFLGKVADVGKKVQENKQKAKN